MNNERGCALLNIYLWTLNSVYLSHVIKSAIDLGGKTKYMRVILGTGCPEAGSKLATAYGG